MEKPKLYVKENGSWVEYQPVTERIYVRSHVYRYEPRRILVVTHDRELAFGPLSTIEPSVRMYQERPEFYNDSETVEVWENNVLVELWDKETGEWHISSDDD